MTAVLTALTVFAALTLSAALVNQPHYADGSRVPRPYRTPWGDVASLVVQHY
jgi:hypothetical protein